MKTIEIVVNPQGEVKVETKGFTGGSCQQASKSLEDGLGTRGGEHMTGEFFATAEQARRQTQSGP